MDDISSDFVKHIPSVDASEWHGEQLADESGITNLRIAIIAQAASDYRVLKVKQAREKDGGKRHSLQKHIDKIEDFFWSEWFNLLTLAPREKVLAQLDKSVEYAIAHDTTRKKV